MSLEDSSSAQSIHRFPANRPPPAAQDREAEAPLQIHSLAPVARMAYVVNSIKAGFRKLGAGVLTSDAQASGGARARRRTNAYTGTGGGGGDSGAAFGGRRAGGNVIGVKRKPLRGIENQNSFEVYLSGLPKVDPVDRTVNWLFHQSESGQRSDDEGREMGGSTRIGHAQQVRYNNIAYILLGL